MRFVNRRRTIMKNCLSMNKLCSDAGVVCVGKSHLGGEHNATYTVFLHCTRQSFHTEHVFMHLLLSSLFSLTF